MVYFIYFFHLFISLITFTNGSEIIEIKVSDTDSQIKYQPQLNHLYIDCLGEGCNKDKLFVFFPGSDGGPQEHKKILSTIANTGIRAIALAYENKGALSAICGNNNQCYFNVRRDRVLGSDQSQFVSSKADGIKNRLLKVLRKLGWKEFYSGDVLLTQKMIIGGFSQGAGMASWIGKFSPVSRICQFSGTWDHVLKKPADWVLLKGTTSPTNYFGITYIHDSLQNGADYLALIWKSLGMATVEKIDTNVLPKAQGLIFNSTQHQCTADPHGCSARDSSTPLNADGMPTLAYLWLYVCGR